MRLLFVEPAEKFLETFVGANFLHSVEFIAELVMRPGLVDEIFAAVTGGRDLASTFATRHDVVSARGDFPQAKDAGVIHKTGLDSSKYFRRQSENGSPCW